MDWVVALLHMVGGEEIGQTSKLVKQAVLKSEKRCGSNNGCLWEDATNHLLTTTLLK